MDPKDENKQMSDAQSPIRGVPVMDIQAPRTTFSARPTQPQNLPSDPVESTAVAEGAGSQNDDLGHDEFVQEPVASQEDQPAEAVPISQTDQPEPAVAATDVTELDQAVVQEDQASTLDQQNVAQDDTAVPLGDDSIAGGQAADAPDVGTQLVAQQEPVEVQPERSQEEIASDNDGHVQPASRKTPFIAAAIAVVVALVLAGAAVFMYLQGQDEQTPNADNTSVNTEQNNAPQAATPVTAEEIDETSQLVDEAISVMDDAALSEETIDDATLGL